MKFYKEYLLGNKVFVRDSEDEPWKQLFPDDICEEEKTRPFHSLHEDLEERLYIGTTVEFDTNGTEFDGLGEIEFKIKKKKIPSKVETIDNVRNRKSKLF